MSFTWLLPSLQKGYPASYEFKGLTIFIFSRPLSKIPQAIQSRSLILNLDIANVELCEDVRLIAAMLPTLTPTRRIEQMDLIHLHADTFDDLFIRMFTIGAMLMGKPDWKNVIRFAL